MGKPEQVVVDMNAAGSEAVWEASKMIHPGANAKHILEEMDRIIEKSGFLSPRQFLAGPQGHLSGLDVDEGTFLIDSDLILEEGMLLVLHPSTAVKNWTPGDYGMFGPGTMFLVTNDGCESLNKAGTELVVIDC